MVTVAFLTVLVLTLLVNILIDMFLRKTSFGEQARTILDLEFGTGLAFLVVQLLIGLAFALRTDCQRRKQNRQTEQGQENG